MVRKSDDGVDAVTRDWIAVTKTKEPHAFNAWERFRHVTFGSTFDGNKAFRVPSLLPPTNPNAIREYIAAVKQIRRSIGWNDANEWQKAA